MVLGKLLVPGRPTFLDCSRARANCSCSRCRWGSFGHFFSLDYHFFFLPPSLWVGWLVGFGFNGPLRQYFRLYRAVSQREGERGKKG